MDGSAENGKDFLSDGIRMTSAIITHIPGPGQTCVLGCSQVSGPWQFEAGMHVFEWDIVNIPHFERNKKVENLEWTLTKTSFLRWNMMELCAS